MPTTTHQDARLHAEVAANRHLRLDVLMREVFTAHNPSNAAIDRPGQPPAASSGNDAMNPATTPNPEPR